MLEDQAEDEVDKARTAYEATADTFEKHFSGFYESMVVEKIFRDSNIISNEDFVDQLSPSGFRFSAGSDKVSEFLNEDDCSWVFSFTKLKKAYSKIVI